MNEPMQVTGPNGIPRWRGTDGKTYDTIDEARVASERHGPAITRSPKPPKLYHVRSEAIPKFLQTRRDVWVAAYSPEEALAYSAPELGLARHGPVLVYDYSDGPVGIVSLGDEECACRTFSEDEQQRILREKGLFGKYTRYSF